MASGRRSIATRSMAGPARVAEAEEAGDLVERLAGGVVDGLPSSRYCPWPSISTSIV